MNKKDNIIEVDFELAKGQELKAKGYKLKLSGLEPLIATNESNFINVGERCNVTGSKAFLNLI
ncbi:MAG TPA: hypothetical protein PK198_05170, partial [Saprospiraceae bacterium]|nr:hypothetical protein [Saprospiraceae bacterium]